MACCQEFDQAVDDGVISNSPAHLIEDGPLMNAIVSEYFLLRPRTVGHSYYPINYCPFCGMPRSQVKQGFAG